MSFNSFQFFLFFPIVTALYFWLPHRFRWVLLLLASCLFYMAFVPSYILILFTKIVVDYGAALLIARSTGKTRRRYLILSIISNLGFLAIFKYYGFATDTIVAAARFLDWNLSLPLLNIILPIGLSFHTFQALSYTIEVYRGRQAPERNLGIYALYVMFFPQLVAGPIERPQNILHQFYEVHTFEYRRVIKGLKLMLWGLFKKMVVADRLAVLVNMVYNHPHDFAGFPFVIATIFFTLQIYCDFSGYSDMAIGLARIFGFR